MTLIKKIKPLNDDCSLFQQQIKRNLFSLIFLCFLGGISFASLVFGNPNDQFEITTPVLEELKSKEISSVFLRDLGTLQGTVFDSEKEFRKTVNGLPNTSTNSMILNTVVDLARINRLIVQSNEFTGDLGAGESTFQGNVFGKLLHYQTDFSAEKIRIFSTETQPYERIIGEGDVRIEHKDYLIESDYVVYQKKEDTLRLKGAVLLQNRNLKMTGDEALLQISKEIATIEGVKSSTNTKGKIELRFNNQGNTENTEKNVVTITARRGELNQRQNFALLEGEVQMRRVLHDLYMSAGKIMVKTNEQREISSAKAEQKVCIEQPGRIARAEKASFNEVAQTVRLEGNAFVNTGKYNLQGNVINLFLDVSKGEAQGDQNNPIQFVFSPSALEQKEMISCQ